MTREPKDNEIAKTDDEIAGYYFPQYKSNVSIEEVHETLIKTTKLTKLFMEASDDTRVQILGDIAMSIAQMKREH